MGGAEPPFLYDPPSRYSFQGPTEKGFNPKAATIASWTPPAPKPKQDGPLINFNKHPDSYLLVPYGNTNATPMSPRTKNRVKYTRYLQLFLRICELLGAIGMLICVICIKGTNSTVGWIIRAAPAIGILHTVYGTYHLVRKAAGRTPASSASYHVFAAMLDTGLIPFYVFSAMMSKSEYSSGDKEWSTLFTDPSATPKIVNATYLLSVTNGGLHIASLVISLCLAVIFRKISKLPPDMNPLEDNLTARPHKRNKSSISAPILNNEKHLSQTSIVSSNRLSNQSDSLISQTRRVPFTHTRTDSVESLHAGNFPIPEKRTSRVDLPSSQFYQQINASNRSSRVDIPMQPPFYQHSNHSAHSSRTDLRVPPKLSPVNRNPPSSIPFTEKPLPGPPQSKPVNPSLPKDNWVSYPSPSPSPPITPSTGRNHTDHHINNENSPPSPVSDGQPSVSNYSRTNTGVSSIKDFDLNLRQVVGKSKHAGYQPIDSYSSQTHNVALYDFDRDLATPAPPQFVDADAEFVKNSRRPETGDSGSIIQPLKKHKRTKSEFQTPTERPSQSSPASAKQFWQQKDASSGPGRPNPLELNPPTPPPNRNNRKSLAATDHNAQAGATRPSAFVGSGGKSRFYGDLNKSFGRESIGGGGSNLSHSLAKDSPEDGNGRVVSNSGADISEYGGNFGNGNAYSKVGGFGGMGIAGLGRRRDVSGKVAEEGRGSPGGAWWNERD